MQNGADPGCIVQFIPIDANTPRARSEDCQQAGKPARIIESSSFTKRAKIKRNTDRTRIRRRYRYRIAR
jgi:hypothetical protein